MTKEGLYPTLAKNLRFEVPNAEEMLKDDFYFGMACNGYTPSSDGKWRFNPILPGIALGMLEGENTALFGPNPDDIAFSDRNTGSESFERVFKRQDVLSLLKRLRETDSDQAARVAFVLGAIARNQSSFEETRVPSMWGVIKHVPVFREDPSKSVEFMVKILNLSDRKSVDAIAFSAASYIFSDGDPDLDKNFARNTYHMSEAIEDDPVEVKDTIDLGLSQMARLKRFINSIKGSEHEAFPDVSENLKVFKGFPTVGAEYHFPLSAVRDHPNFLQRLAILNMSQYQPGSFVQMSRNDRDVIEVRMNPSIYPIAIANWNHIRFLLQEVNQAYFTLTINRTSTNFNWNEVGDGYILDCLRALSMLAYAGIFKNVPTGKEEEVNLGQVYLGQTVRVANGKYRFDGYWGGEEGRYGQMGIYAGFGDTFPTLAYYASMALHNPSVLGPFRKSLPRVESIKDAMYTGPEFRQEVFSTIQETISANPQLSAISESGNKIMELLNP